MSLWARLHNQLVGMTARRHRRIFVASVATFLTSAVLLGFVSFIQWRGHLALQHDTDVISTQASEQLLRALISRRGTLTFIRDTINHQPDLSTPNLRAMGLSAVQHTRHLIGIGLVGATQNLTW